MINHITQATRSPFVETGVPGVTSSPIWGENGNGSDFIAFKAGARFPLHDHEGREEIIMLSGKVRFGHIVVSVGDFLTAGPGDVHDAAALEDSVFFIAHVGGPVIQG